MTKLGFGIARMVKGLAPYALLNLSACLALLLSFPYLAREGAETALAVAAPASVPKGPNLVELREVHAARRPAPTSDMLARMPHTAIPTVPLTSGPKAAVVELVAGSPPEVTPLAAALDSAESLPVKPLRLLHRTRYRGLLAALKRDAQRRAVASSRAVQETRVASARSQRQKRRELLAYTADVDESTRAIFHRNFTTSVAALAP